LKLNCLSAVRELLLLTEQGVGYRLAAE
jgi:hypothetical protein